jgi:hypothetical protein
MDDATHVYIIARIRGNRPILPVKIGISSNPSKRLAGLQTANPFPLVLLTTFYCPTRGMAKELEAFFHETQSDRRLSGEWFGIAPMEAVELLCMNFRAAFDALIEDEELKAIAVEHSGLRENEEKLAAWKAHAARSMNDNGAPQCQ